MAAAIDRATLERLIVLGRARDGLTVADLEAALPIDALDVDALVLVMLELEAAGVSVEPDALGPPSETGAATIELPTPDPAAQSPADRKNARGPGAIALRASSPTTPITLDATAEEQDPVGWAVLLGGLAVLLVLGTILVLI